MKTKAKSHVHHLPPRVVDRSGWGRGPWDNEPEDRIDFEHAGLP